MENNKKISDKINLNYLDNTLDQALWVLDNLSCKNADRYTAQNIATFLVEEKGISISRQAVQSALKKFPKLCNKNSKGYKLMNLGREHLEKTVSQGYTIIIESGKPFSAKNIKLKSIFEHVKGTLRICDPYLDIKSLDVIYVNVRKETPVQILTQNLFDKPSGILSRTLADLKHEGFDIEVRQYSSSDLHDRYLIDDNLFWFSGNSINHLGQKESFLVTLGDDIRQSMLSTFNSRWKTSRLV